VPPQATLIRAGEEVTIPSSEVRLDDTVLLRPGDKVPGLRAAAIRASTAGAYSEIWCSFREGGCLNRRSPSSGRGT
jgi:hypothetical protein